MTRAKACEGMCMNGIGVDEGHAAGSLSQQPRTTRQSTEQQTAAAAGDVSMAFAAGAACCWC